MKSKKLIFFSTLFTSASALASNYSPPGSLSVGDIGQNLFGAEMTIHDFIQAVCITAGVALILGAMVQFQKYRRNPIATKLSTVIFNIVIGLLLIGLAFIPFQL